MIEISDSEIDVEQLMAEIRRAVEQRKAEGERSLIGASIDELLSAARELSAEERMELPPLTLQPEFEPHTDDHYHVNDLLQYHDQLFVWNAYRAILKREPDEPGLTYYLDALRSGRFNKLEILADLHFSAEGKRKGVSVDGLLPVMIRRLYRIPILGYLFELMIGIWRLPVSLRNQPQFEGHALAQQELLAAHMRQLSHTTFQRLDYFSRELAKVAGERRKTIELQQQQFAALVHEQREIIARLEKLKAEMNTHATTDGQSAIADAHGS